jgi:eukaryotic-like serine/threonine-protein kinase
VEFEGTHRFSVMRRLGEGGMGVVYEVFDREKNAAVALKLLRKLAPDAILRFKMEFRALQGISHENLSPWESFSRNRDSGFLQWS